MSLNRFWVLPWCLLAAVSMQLDDNQSGAASENKDDVELLAKQEIQATAEGVSTFLRRLKPNNNLQQRARKLIEQLGDPVFSVRESAVKELIELLDVPLKLLREAATSSDPEVAYRARLVLDDPRTAKKLLSAQYERGVVAAVLRSIRDKPIRKTTSLILEVTPFLDDTGLSDVAADAVAAVAEPDDIPLLRRSIDHKNTAVQVAAIRGLGKAAGRSANSELQVLCRHDDSRVVLAAAHALAAQADRAALPVLVELLSSTDECVRVRGVQILRALTKQSFAYNPYVQSDDQKPKLERWNTWLGEDGLTAPLHVPLQLQPLSEDLAFGLLAHYAFDDDANDRLNDGSGNERHGTPQSAYTLTSRGRGKAIQLRGSGHHGASGGHAILPFIEFSSLQQFTLAIWVRETGMSHHEGEAYITFGTDRGVGTEDALGIAHFNSNLIFRIGGGEVSVPYPDGDRDRWTHYAMTYGNRRLRAYRDGRLIGETSAVVSVKSQRAALGRHWWGNGAGTSARFQGELDDVRIYDRALSKKQIDYLIKAANFAMPPSTP